MKVGTLRVSMLLGVATVVALVHWGYGGRPLDGKLLPEAAPSLKVHSFSVPRADTNNGGLAGMAKTAAAGLAAHSPAISIRQRMETAKDLYTLAKEILPLAQAGDPEAQYVLFETYERCRDKLGADRDNLDEAREQAIANGLDGDTAETGFQLCHGFHTVDAANLGDPYDWLQKATDAGYAPAQAVTASERLLQDQIKASIAAGNVSSDPRASRAPIGGDVNPRDLLAVAAQSGDPAVLMQVGNLQHLLNPTQPREISQLNRAAWAYAGCSQYGCGDWGPGTVVNCGPNDGKCTPVPDSLLSLVDYNWAPVQDKVNQINAAIRAKRWDMLPM